jgi:hypothetical protein
MDTTRLIFHPLCCGLLLFLAAATGCGERGPNLVPAGGVVKYKGAALPEADIVFVPTDGSFPSLGRTDKDGRFQMSTSGKPGLPVGSYKVAITAVRQKRPVSPGEAASMTSEQIEANHETLIPVKYNNVHSSGLTAEVADDPKSNEYTFDLR